MGCLVEGIRRSGREIACHLDGICGIEFVHTDTKDLD
jgi:hypothetical protein